MYVFAYKPRMFHCVVCSTVKKAWTLVADLQSRYKRHDSKQGVTIVG